MVAETDAEGNAKQYQYDNVNRLIAVVDVRKQQYICIQSDSSHAETRPHTTYSEIRSNPHCIVLAYNEYAYNNISSILLRQETGDTV